MAADGGGGPRVESHDVVVIGAGFAGIGMGIRLQREGLTDFVIVEQAGEIGGTWRDNTYPGCACDVPSHLYCYSFEPNPRWSRMFAPWHEIQDYLLHCVEKYRLRPRIRFGTRVVRAAFDADDGCWRLETAAGGVLRARAVVSAIGGLSRPATPDIPGLDTFRGTVMHSARWDHDHDLSGRRVGMIGTGASAIQIAPAIAAGVGRLSVFQRTPPWVFPKPDRPVTAWEQRLFRRVPFLMRVRRFAVYLFTESTAFALYRGSWLSRFLARAGRRYIARQVADPALRARVTPDYAVGCKRLLISNDWYATLQRDNVKLVTSGIGRVTADGVRTADGTRHPLDTLILATGFDVPVQSAPFPIAGLDGRSLDAAWKDGSEAYKGMTISGFPNLSLIMGPNTGPGHTSVLLYMESQIRYITRYLRLLLGGGYRYLDLRPGVQDAFNRMLQARMADMVWTSGCRSWYLTRDGRNTTLWPGFAFEYRLRAGVFRPAEYTHAAYAAAPAPCAAPVTHPAGAGGGRP